MKTYTVYFEQAYRVDIEAENADEAREKFYDAEYDNQKSIELSGVEIFDIEEN